jgi:hypothetical protein
MTIMDPQSVHRLRKAVELARGASHAARLDACDLGDVDEAIEAATQELERPHPNRNTVTLYLNSIARSLIASPAARDAREAIDQALRTSGLPATWEQ